MKQRNGEAGFSLVEVFIALIILVIGILAALQAIAYSMWHIQEAEKRGNAKEVARSTMETIFSIRDLQAFDPQLGAIYNWNAIQIKNGSNGGIFVGGWTPIREYPGEDGIFGTDDDACPENTNCVVGGYTNTSAVLPGIERRIQIYDINENGVVRKRRIDVEVRYVVGYTTRQTVESTIVANLPVN